MPTQARATFDKNIRRAGHFLELHSNKTVTAGAPPAPYRELPRATIVFAVAALDAYLSEVSGEVMVARLQATGASKEDLKVLALVQKDIPGISLEVALLGTQAQRLKRLQEAIIKHFRDNAVQFGSKGVAATCGRIGCSTEALWAALEGDFPKPAEMLDKWTELRHAMIHRGSSPAVRRLEATEFCELVKALVRRLDEHAHRAASGQALLADTP
jgi:hypothetical protein